MEKEIRKFCEICECELHDDVEYCPNCGAKIERVMVKETVSMSFPMDEHKSTEDLNKAVNPQTKTVKPQKRKDVLTWHYIYCIMSLMSAGPACYQILSNVIDAISEESIGLLIAVLVSGSWTIFVAATSILLLMEKAAGIKCIKIKSIIQIVLSVVYFVGGILVSLVGLFAGSSIGSEFEGLGLAGTIVVLIFGIALVLSGIGNLIISIVNLKYYKKHSDLFTK